MKQTLQLRLGQHLTMTPQLQQAIRLLQLSALELQAEVQEVIETNPLLELAEEGEPDNAETENTTQSASDGADDGMRGNDNSHGELSGDGDDNPDSTVTDTLQGEDIPTDLPVDSGWDDVFDVVASQAPAAGDGDSYRDYEGSRQEEQSLGEYLSWQMELTPFSDKDRVIAMAIIDAIDDQGYLATTVDELYQSFTQDLEIDPEEIEAVLHRIQRFDPPGIAARDLRECLLLQLEQFAPDTPWLPEARLVLSEYIDLLGGRDFSQIMRRTKYSREQLHEIINLIQSLNPRPGESIASSPPEYIIPDVIVTKKESKWLVEINPEALPRVRINNHYAQLSRRSNSQRDSAYLKDQMKEARWFIKSLQSRQETLLKVASCIVERQQAFLEEGEEAMKPMVLHDVAEEVNMHESTISRVTTRKYMHTPRGLFELKYFFSSHVSTVSGGECSATAIRAYIKKLIAKENSMKPLSDSKIANLLAQQGINVARRTVAKYREAMTIPPSNERKRL